MLAFYCVYLVPAAVSSFLSLLTHTHTCIHQDMEAEGRTHRYACVVPGAAQVAMFFVAVVDWCCALELFICWYQWLSTDAVFVDKAGDV